MDPADLEAAGRLLSDDPEGWKRPLARLLGPLHPDGPRESLDPRGVDRWHSGAREVPAWVGPALARLLEAHASALEAEAAAARAVAARIAG
ncbi:MULTISPECIES: hypothetical protein [unclassified Methylobacterium]|uniref:hypothetical protein n=1 Tax=unclassified Methylobacterium TaxID=2615210 RepID=UPI0005BAC2E6|nr:MULTISPECIES: hypothetical protein [unclassified Methylobacterium]SFU51837.1 hypothetical protein SAMN02799643_01044 [Methylobacterium sp. UNCCL125]